MDSIEGQARASHSWTLLSSPRQGEQGALRSNQISCIAHVCLGNYGAAQLCTKIYLAIAGIYGAAGACTMVHMRISKIYTAACQNLCAWYPAALCRAGGKLRVSAWFCAGSERVVCMQERQRIVLQHPSERWASHTIDGGVCG